METYIGSKVVNAQPMTRQAYNDFRGWTLPADENGNDEGYLVEYIDGGKANTVEYKGHVNWEPKEVFESAYRSSGNLTFSDALQLLKANFTLTRKGWNGRRSNGKPMTVWLAGGMTVEIDKPYMLMLHADSSIGVWVPVINDILANDWTVVGGVV